jgi:hypothetical protein
MQQYHNHPTPLISQNSPKLVHQSMQQYHHHPTPLISQNSPKLVDQSMQQYQIGAQGNLTPSFGFALSGPSFAGSYSSLKSSLVRIKIQIELVLSLMKRYPILLTLQITHKLGMNRD